MDNNTTVEALIDAANALIHKVRHEQIDLTRFYQGEGLNPEKVTYFLNKAMTEESLANLRAELAADLDAIEQDVTLQMNHRRPTQPGNPGFRAPPSSRFA